MASDMVVALARSTQDGSTFFGYNCNRLRGEESSLVVTAGSEFAPGDVLELGSIRLLQPRRTWTVLAARSERDAGYSHGVNEKGVTVGRTAICTRLQTAEGGLASGELVRLTLERAATVRQAVDILTDLLSRHGQHARDDSAYLLADAGEAYLVEAAGHHWALAQIGSVRAVAAMCLLRQDWDRISRGLADLAIERGWWPADGCKLDFARAVGQPGTDHAGAFRRWGQATLRLEQASGAIDTGLLRGLLGDLAEAVCPLETSRDSDRETTASLMVRLAADPDALPVAWHAAGSPEASVYLPVFPVPALPASFGPGGRLTTLLRRWQADSRQDPQRRAAMHTSLAGVQQSLDEHLREFLPEATDLHRRGQADELCRLAGSFMQHCCDRVEELASLLGGVEEPADDYAEAGVAF